MDKKEINISISSESSSPKEGKGNKFSIKTKFKVLGILGILGIWYLIGPLLSDEKKEYTAIKDECPSYYSPTSTRLVQKTFIAEMLTLMELQQIMIMIMQLTVLIKKD